MTMISEVQKQQVARQLFESNLLKFGEFTLKSGIVSPFYIDLRQAQSFPLTFHVIIEALSTIIDGTPESVFLAGVPEAATPFASALGYELSRPLVQPRKVVKEHGTKSSVEGAFKNGDEVILVDDLITKGDSKLEAIAQVEAAGLIVKKFIVLIDREQGGIDMIREKGYAIEAAMTITELVDCLKADKQLSETQHANIIEFIRTN